MTARDAPMGPVQTASGLASSLAELEPLVRERSERRREPSWLLRRRLEALERLRDADLSASDVLDRLDFASIVRAEPATAPSSAGTSAGLRALRESERAYAEIREALEARGVRFLRTDEAARRHPDLLRECLGSAVPAEAGPFAALNAALWSGGSFAYVPRGVRVDVPLQAEIRSDYAGIEPFERTLIVAEPGSEIEFVEGCTAPVYTSEPVHVSAIEVVARPDSRVRYVALQNFSKDVDNLVTKRALVHERASVEWVDANLGSRRTWKLPGADLVGPGARADAFALSVTGAGQVQEVGASVTHRARGTRSSILLRSVAHRGGRAALRAEVRGSGGAGGSSALRWSALLLDDASQTDAFPAMDVGAADMDIVADGRVRTLGEEPLFYLMSRGLDREEAVRTIVRGIAEDVTRRIPLEYAVEVDRLIDLELQGAIG